MPKSNFKIKKISNRPEIIKAEIKFNIETLVFVLLMALILLLFAVLLAIAGAETKTKITEVSSAPRRLPLVRELTSVEKAIRVISCESGWIHESYGDNGKAYGLAQFHKDTFNWLAMLKGGRLNYYNAQDQFDLLVWAIENNYGYLWTCYRKLGFK